MTGRVRGFKGKVDLIAEDEFLTFEQLHLSSALFATCLRMNPRTLENWEQGRARGRPGALRPPGRRDTPTGSARTLGARRTGLSLAPSDLGKSRNHVRVLADQAGMSSLARQPTEPVMRP